MNLVPELIYKVLEFVVCINVKVKTRSTKVDLYDDDEHQAKDTLLACSVLSRTWRDCTLPHLYHTVAMYCDPRRKHYINAASRHYRRLEDFVAFLAAFPHIQPLIKELRVFFPRDACTEGLDPQISRDREAHDVLLVAKVIDSLPHLRVLHLLDVRLHSCGRAAIQALGLASQRTLHRFEYVMNIYCYWREMDGILDLLSLFSDIKALYLQGVSFQELIPDGSVASEEQNLGVGLNMNLETLRLVSCARVEKFVRIFGPIITSAAQPVTTLELTHWGIWESNENAHRELWRTISPSVVHLTLALTQGTGYGGGNANDFDVSRCTDLASATFYVLAYDNQQLDEPWEHIAQTMSRLLACSRLRRVTLFISSRTIPVESMRQHATYERAFRGVEDVFLQLRARGVHVVTYSWRRGSLPSDRRPVLNDCTTVLFPQIC